MIFTEPLINEHISQKLLVPEDFPGAPLLPGNTVDIDTIQSQRFYCDKYQTVGQWIYSGGKVATVFYHNGKQYCLPFRAIFKPDMLYWLKESAILQMEDAIKKDMLQKSRYLVRKIIVFGRSIFDYHLIFPKNLTPL